MPLLTFRRHLNRFGEMVRDGLRYLRNQGPWRMTQKLLALAIERMRRLLGGEARPIDRFPRGAGKRVAFEDEVLNLQPGELVEVKPEDEIRETFDGKNSSKGLLFLPEMREYCGKRFQVLKRLERMMIESTSEIRRVKNTVLLEGVMCNGSRHDGCNRSCFFYWREAWLRRVEGERS
jgi:hypothetical protein